MSKKIKVSSACIACGMCLVSPYIEELSDGKVRPKATGILPDEDEAGFLKILNDCPAKAISLEKTVKKNKEQIIAEAEKKITAFSLSAPTKKELAYDKKYADFPVPGFVRGEERPEYSSYSSAKSAAKEAINQAMFSQRGTIMRNIVNNYCMDKLAPYTRYDETDKNFFYSANKKAESILEEIAGELQSLNPQKKIPEYMLKIQSRPDTSKDWEIKSLKEDILYQSDVIISREMQGEYYTLASYADNCDIDSQEIYAGKGMFGREKYVDKYYFSKTKLAFEEIARDIRSACDGAFNDVIVDEFALGMTKSLVERYEKRLKDELNKKLLDLEKINDVLTKKMSSNEEDKPYPEWINKLNDGINVRKRVQVIED